MRKLILIVFAAAGLLNAQNESGSQSIELPDFVITGIQNITVPEMTKSKPELINSLSDEFFRPVVIPEKLSLINASAPKRIDYNTLGISDYSRGLLILGGGINTLPTGHFYFNQSSNHFLLGTHVWGSNIREYIDNAGYNVSGAEVSTDFFISSRSSFLPGLKISADGTLYRDSYKLFASAIAGTKRENENISGSLSLTNNLSETFRYGFSGNYQSLKFKHLDFVENVAIGKVYLESDFGKFGFNLTGEYQYQDPKNKLSSEGSYTYYNGSVGIHVNTFESFRVKFGLCYAKQDTSKLVSPTFAFDLKLDDNISMSGGYTPHINFIRTRDLLDQNKFYLPGTVDNIVQLVNSFTEIAVKYEFYTNFELSVGGNFSNVDNMYYFDDSGSTGIYTFQTLDNVKDAQAYAHVALHNGPVGHFYGDVTYHYTKTDTGFRVPYVPAVTAKLTWGVDLGEYMDLSASIDYFSKSYTDILNNVELDSFIDLSFIAKYAFIGNLKLTAEVNNILNRDNEFYKGYINKPLDVIAGIEYRW